MNNPMPETVRQPIVGAHRRWRKNAAILFTLLLYILVSVSAAYTGGVQNPLYASLILVVLLAAAFASPGWGLAIASLSILSGIWLWRQESLGLLPAPLLTPLSITYWIIPGLSFLAALWLITAALRQQQKMLNFAQSEQAAALAEIRQLQTGQSALEQELLHRSQLLETALQNWQLAIEIGSTIFAIADPQQWAQTVLERIQEHFNLYFAGIFLVQHSQEAESISDAQLQWAVLYAGTGEAGAALRKRNYRVQVGTGMVGWSISNRRARLASQTEADAVRLATPELPAARSEAAIPLRVQNLVIGAISVQSEKPAAFDASDLDILQVLADLIAGALHAAQAKSSTDEKFQPIPPLEALLETALHKTPNLSWLRSYQYVRAPLVDAPPEPFVDTHPAPLSSEIQQAIQQANSTVSQDGTTLFTPLKVRHQAIGMLTFRKDASQQNLTWSDEEISILESIAEQLGAAIDSARLYEDTQRLARRERIAAEATGRIRQTLDIETVLRAAAQEVHKITQAAQVIISLAPADALPDASLIEAPPGDSRREDMP